MVMESWGSLRWRGEHFFSLLVCLKCSYFIFFPKDVDNIRVVLCVLSQALASAGKFLAEVPGEITLNLFQIEIDEA